MKAARGPSLAAALALALAVAEPAGAQETPYAPSPLPPPGTPVCPGGLCQAWALDRLFRGFADIEAERLTPPVHIVQIGDSHTAGDRITGKVRAALQARFGDGGRGVLPPGIPYEGYAPYQVEVSATGWRTTLAPLAGGTGFRTAGVGLTGVQAITVEPGGALRLRPEGPDGMSLGLSICGEGEGRFILQADEERWERSFLDRGQPRSCVYVMANGWPREIVVQAADGPLRLHDIRLTYLSRGVTVSNLGVIGATLRDLAARDDEVVALQLANWRPSLIVLAFGTNEGFEDGLDPVAYETLLRAQVERLGRMAPGASLLILGAPDALRSGQADGCSADGLRAPPPSLAVVRDVQRRVAADMGVAFWDWHGRMGGDCSADRLALMSEPYVRGDRVHFTGAGADWIGGVLAADLLAAYDAWKAGRGSAD